jgi:phosphoserine phosphatase RsbX
VPERSGRPTVEWGLATECRRGEAASGDVAVIAPHPDGTLVAGIDGLGHGTEAAHAARVAATIVSESQTQDLQLLIQRCHHALRGTRGAAISVAFVSSSHRTITWLGVGNVEGRVLSPDPAARRPKGSLPLARGVPGHELPAMVTTTVAAAPGDVLVLATDGIVAAFADSLDISGSAQAISERIMTDHWKQTDDALVLAVRYLGEQP